MSKNFDYEKYTKLDAILDELGYAQDLREKERILVKEKLEKHFNFEVPDYIADDILDCKKYHHICLIVNLAVTNKELTEENGEILKKELKEIFAIRNDYERIRKETIINQKTFTFEEWHEKYCNYEFIDINKFLTDNDKEMLKKLGINLKNRLYTEREFEVIDLELCSYYRNEEDMEEEELEEVEPLPEDINREDYEKLINKFSEIGKNCNLFRYR